MRHRSPEGAEPTRASADALPRVARTDQKNSVEQKVRGLGATPASLFPLPTLLLFMLLVLFVRMRKDMSDQKVVKRTEVRDTLAVDARKSQTVMQLQ